MNLEWLKLRHFNGSINNGFEELICQLANAEKIENRTKFVRVAAPDAGVECYCILVNGDEIGWQGKFFKSMGTSQWAQLDKSFKTAVKKHPKLKKYIVCIPLDRPDPRILKKGGKKPKHLMDVWNSKAKRWTEYAKSLHRTIEIEYWGSYEIFDRLAKPENKGRQYFWFNKEELTNLWFKQKLEEATKNLGERYTPKLNFELPQSLVFDGLYRDKHFKKQWFVKLDDLVRCGNKISKYINDNEVKDDVEKIVSIISDFRGIVEKIDFVEIDVINEAELSKYLEEIELIVNKVIEIYYSEDNKRREEEKRKSDKHYYGLSYYGWERENFRKVSNSARQFRNFILGTTVALSNNPCFLLRGEAGRGKSHLLADIANKRLEGNQFTLLILGQSFNNSDPWQQILNQLQLNCQRDIFLASLDAKAEASGSRIIIFIDAVNEGEGKNLWPSQIAGFIATIKRHPHLGVVFSVRTTYEKIIFQNVSNDNNEILRLTHTGFQGYEYEACKLFFKYYKIEQPSIPLLHPEFSNPLFLKLFCKGIQKRNNHKIPDGFEGITTIMNYFLESINLKISQKHDLPSELNIINKIAKELAAKISESSSSFITYDKAFEYVTGLNEIKAIHNKPTFFTDLISEGLLTQNLHWDDAGNNYDAIYFAYERLGDHLRAEYLLGRYLDKDHPKEAFNVGQPLYELTKDFFQCERNQGLMEALSIQIPELVNFELYEVAEHLKGFYPTAAAFMESIIWRKKEFFSEKTKNFITANVLNNRNLEHSFIDIILQITSTPEHPFNSDFLHKILMQFSMADRDAWWTQLIHNKYPGYPDEITSVKRLIDWAWSSEDRSHIVDESIRLMAQTLLWFHTSVNRKLRDSATKALICLLQDRIPVLIQLIKTFQNVNDPYILQRLYAVTYGCTLKTSKTEMLKDLGDCVYETVFKADEVIPDILLRDYARGVIEYGNYIGHSFEFDLEKIRPPYKSTFPQSFPTNEEITAFDIPYSSPDYKPHYAGIHHIFTSMGTEDGRTLYGDFGRYVFDSAFRYWEGINTNDLSNLGIKWIIEEMGYNVEKHGNFDNRIGSGRGRGNDKEERIGKKYQWIVMHKLLAIVADNCRFRDDLFNSVEFDKYEGPWAPFVRDIDPTITINEIQENKFKPYWWCPTKYNNWKVENKKWLLKKNDLPDPIKFVEVVNEEGQEWLVLQIFQNWKEPKKIGEEEWGDTPRKDLWYQIRSYITNEKDYKKITDWTKNRNFMGRWMPESGSRYEMFDREYFWSPANKTFSRENQGGQTWRQIIDRKTNKQIGNVALTILDFSWSEQYDASKETSISFYKPTEILFNLLDLQYSTIEGNLLNKNGELICFDPGTTNPTYSCLLVRKSDLLKELKKKKLNIFWTVLAEKNIIGNSGKDWIGRLEISGVVNFEKGKLKHIPHFVGNK